MSMFSEDPTLPVGALIVAAVACFLALRTRQEGKYLIWGLSLLGLAGLVLAVEWLWVTDEERIETVVYDLRRALLASDAEGMLAHFTPDVQYVQSGESLPTAATRALVQASLAQSRFDVVRIRGLQTSAGKQTRRGKAEFKAFVRGSVQGPFGMGGDGATDTSWSLGFEETKPGVWKVNRITPLSMPYNPALLAGAIERAGGAESVARSVTDRGLQALESLQSLGDSSRRSRFDRKSVVRDRERARAGFQ